MAAFFLPIVLLAAQVAGYSGVYDQQGRNVFTDMPMTVAAFEVTVTLYVHSFDSAGDDDDDDATIFEITDLSGDNKIKLRLDGSSRLEFEVGGYDGSEDCDTSSGDVVHG